MLETLEVIILFKITPLVTTLETPFFPAKTWWLFKKNDPLFLFSIDVSFVFQVLTEPYSSPTT
ncbi:MAG TPA: hypothetical protein ENI42_02285, partial [Thermoplasmatales archaeon]|nr:hypothetical protein [Thermoplasmatales archaeon]